MEDNGHLKMAKKLIFLLRFTFYIDSSFTTNFDTLYDSFVRHVGIMERLLTDFVLEALALQLVLGDFRQLLVLNFFICKL